MSNPQRRRRPNILITGTPGVGKTVTASMIAENLEKCDHWNVGEVIQRQKFYEGKDEALDSYVLDEDQLLDYMETALEDINLQKGRGIVADYHACEFFPERWFDLVLVLRTKTEILFDRLSKRGYSDHKRSENMECEIMQVVLEEARESYAPEIVHEVPSNTLQDMESNVERVQQWCDQWMKNKKETKDEENDSDSCGDDSDDDI